MGTNAIRHILKRMLLCLLLTSALGFKTYDYYNSVTDYEIRLLPHYLQVKVRFFFGERPDDVVKEFGLYAKKLGQSVYDPLHHYGFGLIYMHRAKAQINYPRRTFDIESAIREFNFVITYSPPDSFILYEVFYNRGEAFLFSNQISNAMKDFHKSTTLKPDFLDAYVMLSGCYRKSGDINKAEEVLKLGQSRAAPKGKPD